MLEREPMEPGSGVVHRRQGWVADINDAIPRMTRPASATVPPLYDSRPRPSGLFPELSPRRRRPRRLQERINRMPAMPPRPATGAANPPAVEATRPQFTPSPVSAACCSASRSAAITTSSATTIRCAPHTGAPRTARPDQAGSCEHPCKFWRESLLSRTALVRRRVRRRRFAFAWKEKSPSLLRAA